MTNYPPLSLAIKRRKDELYEEAQLRATEEERLRLEKEERESKAVRLFKDWLSSEYELDAYELNVKASQLRPYEYNIDILFESDIVVLLVPFSTDIKAPMVDSEEFIWRAVRGTHGYDYENFIDAAYYVKYGKDIEDM